ncbi:MAG: RNA 2',3'-cyclic phosphodiesterase [Proteobacteria bacterium]|nr:RNA 2',3'-cyclic phosphodiesterase [Pseudomonadota bacterium]
MNLIKMTKRLFVGVPLEPAAVKVLKQLQAKWQMLLNLPVSTLIPEENFHLTLHFLGSIHETQIVHIQEGLKSHEQCGSFLFSLGQCLAFPNQNRARVISLAGSAGNSPLSYLFQQVGTTLETLGVPLETMVFVPHVTLLRFRELLIPEMPVVAEPLNIKVSSYVLYLSDQLEGKTTYRAVHSWRLK